MNQDEKFMRETLRLAAAMRGRTSPDPMVGAVLVKGNKILSRGYHAEVATPHAETFALSKARGKTKGATLYINLEPCCHFGNNPPCTSKIIKAKIKRVVAAMIDPNPLVSGKGIKELKKAGIAVTLGILEKEAQKLNEVFVKYITTRKPFVILKSALTLDGKLTSKNRWLTGLKARKQAHFQRSCVDAILVGIGTVLKDDPALTVRHAKKTKENPYKIVLDSRGRIPLNSKILKNEPQNALVVTTPRCPKTKIKKIESAGATVLLMKKINLPALLLDLGKMKIASLLVEGGRRINTSVLKSNLADRIMLFISPQTSQISKALDFASNKVINKVKLKNLSTRLVGKDLLIEGEVIK